LVLRGAGEVGHCRREQGKGRHTGEQGRWVTEKQRKGDDRGEREREREEVAWDGRPVGLVGGKGGENKIRI
jgi:hypothetical protein